MQEEQLMRAIKKLYQPERASDAFSDMLYERVSQKYLEHVARKEKTSTMFWFMRAGVFAVCILALAGSYEVVRRGISSKEEIPLVQETTPEHSWRRAMIALPEILPSERGGGGEEVSSNIIKINILGEQEKTGKVYRFSGRDIPTSVKTLFRRPEVYRGEEYALQKDGFVFTLSDEGVFRSLRFVREAGGEGVRGDLGSAEEVRAYANAFLRTNGLYLDDFLEEDVEIDETGEWVAWYVLQDMDGIALDRKIAVIAGDAFGVESGWIEIFGGEKVYDEVEVLSLEDAIARAVALGDFGDTQIEVVKEEQSACMAVRKTSLVGDENGGIFAPNYVVRCEDGGGFVIPAWSE
jgi:hypothetical protein